MGDRAGIEKDAAAVALLPRLDALDIDAVGERVRDAAGLERLARIGLQTRAALVEIELAFAPVAERRGTRRHDAQLDAVLAGAAVLPVDLPVDAVGQYRRQAVDLVTEGDARA